MSVMRLTMLRRWGFPVLVIGLVLAVQVLPGPRPVDDAYITFRYARNLANGWGFVYNAGQPVLGTTTPLFTLLLAAFKSALPGLDLPWLAVTISAGCDVATILLLRRLARALVRSDFAASVIALIYLLDPVRIGVALGGMETSLVVMWLVAAAEAYVARERDGQAALFSALAFLTRPDAIVLPLLLAGQAVLFRRRLPWREAAVFAAVSAPWLIWAAAYFGSPLPLSITAKTQAYFHYPTHALTTLVDFLVTRAPLSNARASLAMLAAGLTVSLALYVAGALHAGRGVRRAWPISLLPLTYLIGFSLANPVIFVWYYPPILVWWDMLLLVGVWALIGRRDTPRRRLAFVCIGGLTLLWQWLGAGEFTGSWPIDFRDREIDYGLAAAQLHARIAPGSRVALPEIGVFGYEFEQADIIDTVGLVSPEAVPYLLKEHAPDQTYNYAVSEAVIEALKPDYVISLRVFINATLERSTWFFENYELIGEWDTRHFGSNGLLAFRRRAAVH
jgi:hypothetical protein